MANFDDFDLDLKKRVNPGNENETEGAISFVTGIIVGSVLTGCTDNCLTTKCTTGGGCGFFSINCGAE